MVDFWARRVYGSIPACAGEPWLCPRRVTIPAVYPRVCGGTAGDGHIGDALSGLSPRVRGNRGDLLIGHNQRGSIPACAGEPWAAGFPSG